jgi:excisionase family DNA binding protein
MSLSVVPDLAHIDVVAQHVGLKVSTIERLTRLGKIPAVKLGPKTTRYRLEDVREAIAKMGTTLVTR